MKRSYVAEHYNQIKSIGVKNRQSSKIISVREVNNFVKNKLLEKYVAPKSVVFDLGCGKGGDLSKYKFRAIKHYFGCDVADVSLKEALSRASNCQFKADFITADFAQQNIKLEEKADVVVAQFSLHYAFSSEEALTKAVKNIDRNLKDNGVFLATLPNEDVILRRAAKAEFAPFGNTLYKIEPLVPELKEEAYGQSYNFYLEEAVVGCMEYLASTKLLTSLLGRYGIVPIMESDFLTILNTEIKADPGVYNSMVRNTLNREELQIVELYKAVAYRKAEAKKK
ncbi:mRNA (guanine-N7-)-methyltransferase [Nematocida sp. AWRm77]|nr:mRNA (guanine-N7-)-methyltransferase [Nematocida sp. AWRm77]